MSRSNHLYYHEVPFRLSRPVPRPNIYDEICDWIAGLGLGFALVLLVVSMFSLGCQSPEPQDPLLPSAEWCEAHQCQVEALTYTAAGEGIAGMLGRDLARWARATGRTDLGTSLESGIPVVWSEDLISEDDGRELCGQTTAKGKAGGRFWTQVVELDPTPPPGCPAPELTLLHELIHAMNPVAEHLTVDSLFASSTGPSMRPIDEPALVALCSGFACSDFQPETSGGDQD